MSRTHAPCRHDLVGPRRRCRGCRKAGYVAGGAATALVVAGGGVAFALLAATATGNTTATSGTLSLTMGANGVGLSIPLSSLAPGDIVNRYVTLTNGGTLSAAGLSVAVTGTGATLLTTDPTKGLTLSVANCTVAWTPATGVCGGTTGALLSAAPLSTLAAGTSLLSTAVAAGATHQLKLSFVLPTRSRPPSTASCPPAPSRAWPPRSASPSARRSGQPRPATADRMARRSRRPLTTALIALPVLLATTPCSAAELATAPGTLTATSATWAVQPLDAAGTPGPALGLNLLFPVTAVAVSNQYLWIANTGSTTLTGASYTLQVQGIALSLVTLTACTGGNWNTTLGTCPAGSASLPVSSTGSSSLVVPASPGARLHLKLSILSLLNLPVTVNVTVAVSSGAGSARQIRPSSTTDS